MVNKQKIETSNIFGFYLWISVSLTIYKLEFNLTEFEFKFLFSFFTVLKFSNILQDKTSETLNPSSIKNSYFRFRMFIFFDLFKSLNPNVLQAPYIFLKFLAKFEQFSSFCRETTLSNEMYGQDSEVMEPPAASHMRRLPEAKFPPRDEIEEFFATAEKYQKNRFAEK